MEEATTTTTTTVSDTQMYFLVNMHQEILIPVVGKKKVKTGYDGSTTRTSLIFSEIYIYRERATAHFYNN